jgi:hypothetical protein
VAYSGTKYLPAITERRRLPLQPKGKMSLLSLTLVLSSLETLWSPCNTNQTHLGQRIFGFISANPTGTCGTGRSNFVWIVKGSGTQCDSHM